MPVLYVLTATTQHKSSSYITFPVFPVAARIRKPFAEATFEQDSCLSEHSSLKSVLIFLHPLATFSLLSSTSFKVYTLYKFRG